MPMSDVFGKIIEEVKVIVKQGNSVQFCGEFLN
jgi:hypothetical protein